ncbi:MAG: phosphate acetyltransferase [Castellaniella sp.]|uniref:phosphate acetyltransferase n=1 Tax=Castellaniella sp. TaxID=1955812 RepID=UPI003A87DC81
MRAQDMLLEAARRNPKRIVLCEGADPRVQSAARQAAADGIAEVFLLESAQDIPGVHCIRPDDTGWLDAFTEELLSLRRARGMTPEQASQIVHQPLVFAALMVRLGQADGSVAGAVHTTADVVRTAIQVIGRQPGTQTISSFFIMMRDEPFPTGGHTMVFSDCGLVIEPSSHELAEIALASARSTQALLGIEPRVAMLSFSTHGSAAHKQIDRIREAMELARQQAPDLLIDGEMQLDTAIVPEVAHRKWAQSPVAGRANVLVFPSLDAGNIGYKLVERLGHATALGPILQGLNKPANDLSRGCSADDIHQVIAVTVAQAASAR